MRSLRLGIGVRSVLAPLTSAVAITVTVGVLLMIGGAGQIALALRAGVLGRGLLLVLTGAVSALVGLLLVLQPLTGIATITLFLAVYFLVSGILAVIAAFNLRPDAGWLWMLANGVVTFLLGLLIWRQWPLSGAWAIGVLFGVQLVSSGAALVVIGTAMRRALKSVAPAA
jgi:uncharacterized membrane protein HdeD (DUF308 family)